MCGILCHIGKEEILPDHPAIQIISHRGPDDYGAISFDLNQFRVGLGHRRLSIIDLSELGHQPMSYADDRYWITYNGEIYNYIEIREELIKDSYSFISSSDTEVLLAAYTKWGRNCLDRFNGMFSFCLYDREKNKILIVRDRMGIKPLYYHNSPDGFSAVSEIKQFTGFSHFEPKVNPGKLYHFLNSSDFSFDNETMWNEVYELQAGCYIELDLNKWKPGDPVNQCKWYELNYSNENKLPEGEAGQEFMRLLKESVKLRLRADVPVGFLLSGGLDSSTLLGLSTQIMKNDNTHLKTFSSCYEGSSIDESLYIKDMLKFTGADSSLHYPKPADVEASLDKVIWNCDLPVRSGSPVPHWLLYEFIKNDNDGRKVILEGQGADEILCGYRDFFWGALYENLTLFKILTFFKDLSAVRRRHNYPLKVILRKFKRLAFPGSISYPANPVLNNSALLGNNPIPDIAIVREQPSIHRMHQARLKILSYILHNVDRNSMAHSRETRVPFLDHNLVEFCINLPSKYKISDGLTKQVMRKSIHGVISEKVRSREDKQGYSSPVAQWISTELKEVFRENIKEAANLPYVNKDILIKNSDSFFEGKAVFDPTWWNIVTTSRWLKTFKISL